MEISNSKMFRTLYKKDLMLGRNESLLIAATVVIANLFLVYKAQTKWPVELSFGLSLMLFGFIPLSIFFKAFTIIGNEWKENTVYLMMSLPVSSNITFLSKLTALFTQLILLIVLAAPFTIFLFFSSKAGIGLTEEFSVILRSINVIPGEYIVFCIQIVIIIALSYLFTIILVFFSTVIGRMFHKCSGLITATTFIGTNILFNYIISGIGFIGSKFISVPETEIFNYLNNYIFPGTILGTAALIVGFFYLTTTLYDKKIEL